MKTIDIEIIELKKGNFSVLEKNTAVIFGGDFDIFKEEEIKAETKFEIKIYQNDSFADLKNKIFLAYGVAPCEQYLFDVPDYSFGKSKIFIQEDFELEGGFPVYNDLYKEEIIWEDFDHHQCSKYINKKLRVMFIKNFLQAAEISNKLIFFTVRLFYPYFNYNVITNYLENNSSIFPQLYPSKTSVNKRVLGSDTFNAEFLESAAKSFADNKNFLKNEHLVYGKNSDKNTSYIAITSITILLEKRGEVDAKKLFELFETSDDVPIVRYFTKTLIYTKIYGDLKIKFHQNLKNIKYGTTGTVAIICEDLIFEITGPNIYCILSFPETAKIDFNDVFAKIHKSTKLIFSKLDNLIFSPFNGEKRTKIMKFEKIKGILNLDYFFNHSSIVIPGFIDKESNGYFWMKGIKKVSETDYVFSPSFYYENCYFLINETKRSTSIEFYDLNEEYFRTFAQFILFQSGRNVVPKNSLDWDKVKLLRFEDNLAYDSRNLKKSEVYARFCQTKDKQPLIITEEETKNIKNKKRILKHWNYTKNAPAFYYCDSDKFPFPYFITGRHINNFCLVCCKKTTNVNKQEHEKCQTNYFFNEDSSSSSSRYVNIYKKKLEPGRVGQLHPLLAQFLVYNMSNINIISESVSLRIFRYESRIYSIDKIFKITKNTKPREFKLKYFEKFLDLPVWKEKRKDDGNIKPIDVLKNPEKNRKYKNHMKRIKDADLSFPIYIYMTDQGYIIIDGMHRLAKAFLENREIISVKEISKKQLERSQIGSYSLNDNSFFDDLKLIKGGDDKSIFYYKIGVEKYYKKTNCSAGYAIAAALNMTFEIYLQTLSSLIDCPDLNEFINLLDEGITKDWNDFFIKHCYLFNIFPIIFEDKNTELNLVLYEDLKNFKSKQEFQFLFLMLQQENSVFDFYENFYFPIFIIIPYAFFKNGIIEKRLFYYDETFVRIIENLLYKEKKDEFNVYDLDKINGVCYLENNCCFVKTGDFSISSYNIKQDYVPIKYKNITMNENIYDKFFKDLRKSVLVNKNTVNAVILDNKIFPFNFPNKSLNEKDEIIKINYSLEEIFTSDRKTDFFGKYWALCGRRNNYSIYKKNIFAKHPNLIDKPELITGEFAEELKIEVSDPIKKELFKNHVYIFEDIYFNKNKKEKIYVKWNKQ